MTQPNYTEALAALEYVDVRSDEHREYQTLLAPRIALIRAALESAAAEQRDWESTERLPNETDGAFLCHAHGWDDPIVLRMVFDESNELVCWSDPATGDTYYIGDVHWWRKLPPRPEGCAASVSGS